MNPLVIDQQRTLIRQEMERQGVTQAEMARRTGRTPKHINQVFNGKAGTAELDYWAFVLGVRFVVQIEQVTQ